jgi:hypothetical protein
MSVEIPPVFPDEKAQVVSVHSPTSDQFAIKTEDGILTKEEAKNLITPEAEKRLVRKMDIRVLLPIAVIFFWAFVDRVNLAYAHLQGLDKDLGMSGNMFNIALLVQIAPFIFFEIPSNLMIKRVRPSYWLSGMSLGWGFMTLGQGLVTNFSGLVVLRVFLGVFEAGLVPGVFHPAHIGSINSLIRRRLSHLDVLYPF